MRVTVLTDDDWKAIYIDDTLQYEGHSIPAFWWTRVIEQLGHPATIKEVEFELNGGAAPERLSDLRERPERPRTT
jgi:hypothetical protein